MKKFSPLSLSFTMVELIFVIIIISILSIYIVPNFHRKVPLYIDGKDTGREVSPELIQAANQVLRHIRYTRHLAMIDNKFDPRDPKWFMQRWRIFFRNQNGQMTYSIFSDEDKDVSPEQDEAAVDSLTNQKLYAHTNYNQDIERNEYVRIGVRYGVSDVEFSDECEPISGTGTTTGNIIFDFLGRPYYSMTDISLTYDYLLQDICSIRISNLDGDNIYICITPETGYSFICDR